MRFSPQIFLRLFHGHRQDLGIRCSVQGGRDVILIIKEREAHQGGSRQDLGPLPEQGNRAMNAIQGSTDLDQESGMRTSIQVAQKATRVAAARCQFPRLAVDEARVSNQIRRWRPRRDITQPDHPDTVPMSLLWRKRPSR
jgi:hypothetical protein